MPSTFWGLNIATSGMNASQIALNTTSHNIANVNTTGYSKQSADITAAEALRVHREYGMFGSGVTVVDINRARESYYDVKYWNNNQNYGQQEVMHYYMEQIQLHFNEFGVSTTGFSEVYEDLFNALDELSNAPSEVNYRNVVIQHASSLTEYFENISINLQSIQEECNNEIKNITGRINSYAEGIASLNEQIRILQMNGGEPNDLFDKRDVLVDELSKIVNLNVADVLSDIGSSSYRIKINGQLLVDGDSYGELTVVPRTAVNKRNEEDMQGLYDVVWKTGVSFDEYHAETGGELQGYINI
ncbi:MAG: flagellar hook-associated protein FlgK, partial [Lachnospiraceae bacterium]|nr:flagellar hook-associated protein FlgK [Lachnospiraceae bacterium]